MSTWKHKIYLQFTRPNWISNLPSQTCFTINCTHETTATPSLQMLRPTPLESHLFSFLLAGPILIQCSAFKLTPKHDICHPTPLWLAWFILTVSNKAQNWTITVVPTLFTLNTKARMTDPFKSKVRSHHSLLKTLGLYPSFLKREVNPHNGLQAFHNNFLIPLPSSLPLTPFQPRGSCTQNMLDMLLPLSFCSSCLLCLKPSSLIYETGYLP